jgi:hypothetical protein
MTHTDQNSPDARRRGGHALHQLTGAVGRAARAVAATVAECNRAQRRMAELQFSPDRFLMDGGAQPPDTYAEFLFRTSGPLSHEPPADKRFAGRHARR